MSPESYALRLAVAYTKDEQGFIKHSHEEREKLTAALKLKLRGKLRATLGYLVAVAKYALVCFSSAVFVGNRQLTEFSFTS